MTAAGRVGMVALIALVACVPRQPQNPQPPPPPVTVVIDSEPQGALVRAYSSYLTQTRDVGLTPCSFVFPTETSYSWRLTVAMEGYQTEAVALGYGGKTHVKLLKDPMPDFRREARTYATDLKRRIVDVVGLYDKALNSPKMLARGVISQGDTEIKKLVLDYPDRSDGPLHRALLVLDMRAKQLFEENDKVLVGMRVQLVQNRIVGMKEAICP